MKVRSLIKASMTEGMDIFNGKRGGKGVKIFAVAVMFIAFFGWAASMLISLRAVNSEVAILSMAVAATTLLTIIEGIYKAGSLLFNCRDDGMLLALPIPRSRIVALRIFKFYVFELAFNSLFLVPVILAFAVFARPDWWFFPVSILMIIMLPIIPIAISCVIGAIISALSSRFKKHNLMQTVLAFVFMIAVMVVSFKASDFTRNIGNYAGGISDAINRFYYPAKVYVEQVASFDLLQLLVFVLVHVLVVVATVAFIAKIYFRINSRAKVVRTATKPEKVVFSGGVKKPFFALVKKELSRFFNTPVFMTNAGFGLILFLLGVGIICFKFNDLALAFENQEAPVSLDVVQGYLPLATFALVAFCSMMTFMTASMVSLEGKAISLTKSLPVSARKILFAKVAASLVIVLPPILVGVTVMIIRFQFGIAESMLLVVAGITLPLVTELFGILTDLRYANFNAETDTEVVKQSTSVMVATFVGLGGSMVVIGVTVAMTFVTGQIVALAVMDAILVAVFGGLYLYFAKTCEKKFSRLQS